MTILDEFSTHFAGSRAMHAKASTVLPGGLSHDLRHMRPFPVFVDRAAGSRKWDVDGHELICYHMGHGALLLGHGHPAIVRAVALRTVSRRTSESCGDCGAVFSLNSTCVGMLGNR